MNRLVYLTSVLLIALFVTVALYRVTRLGTPVMPSSIPELWNVEVQITPSSSKKQTVFEVPSILQGAKTVEERFRAEGLAGEITERGGQRKLVLGGSGESVYYTVTLRKGAEEVKVSKSALKARESTGELLSEQEAKRARILSRKVSRNEEPEGEKVQTVIRCVIQNPDCGFERLRGDEELTAKTIAAIVSDSGVLAIPAMGFVVRGKTTRVTPRYWIYAKVDGFWRLFPLNEETALARENLLFWNFLLDNRSDVETRYALIPVYYKKSSEAGFIGEHISLENLPLSLQNTFSLLLLIPLGALLISVYRVLLGFPTFGTFMPILMSLAFRECGLVIGVLLFCVVISIGLIIRFGLGHLRLLLVPRLAATLSIVIFLVLIFTWFSHEFDFDEGLKVTLFPIVILTMMIERMCISWEETGAIKTLTLFVSSLAAATLGYFIMVNRFVEHFVFSFPETLFFTLALTLLIGRYTGFRLSELYRFRSLRDA